MKRLNMVLTRKILIIIAFLLLFSCNKFKEYNQPPELTSLQQGLKTSMAVGYCASIAMSAFKGEELPSNVSIITKHSDEFSRSWTLYIKINKEHPLPFNDNIGDIVVSGLGREDGGVISILFGDVDILGGKIKLYGLHLVPVQSDIIDTTKISAVFFAQDFVFAQDNALLEFNLTKLQFESKMSSLSTKSASDPYIAVKQNFWIIDIYQNCTFDNVYDDDYYINGGGQIVEVQGATEGVVYHAMLDTKVNYSVCSQNPIHGFAISQNLRIQGDSFIDLGNSLLSFHSNCEGIAHIDFSSGKYIMYNGKDIALNLH